MSKRLFVLISLLVATSMLLAACGGGGGAPAAGTLKIVSSLPMTGASLTQTQTIVNAEMMRLDQVNNSACGGKYKLAYEAWDDASAALGKWDPAVETENANKAAADKSIVAYLGTFNSGAAKLSIPILNQAGPLVMISPANTYPGLTIAAEGITVEGEPDKYYPSGVRNYARVAPADIYQSKVLAKLMTDLGVKTVYIVDDQEAYGKGIADATGIDVGKAGITVVGHEGFDPKASDYKALMTKISTSNAGGPPDAVFAGAVVDNNLAQLIKDKVAIMGDNTKVKFIVPDGGYTQATIDGAGKDVAEGVFGTTPGLALKDLGPNGKKFLSDYEAKYGHLTEPYAVLGYDAMSAALKAIEDVCASGGDPTNREAVRAAVFAIKDFEGALGTWSFDANGDINLPFYLAGQVHDGAYADYKTYTP
jgi:branched-chain amino acid transport system substrate-binding protein